MTSSGSSSKCNSRLIGWEIVVGDEGGVWNVSFGLVDATWEVKSVVAILYDQAFLKEDFVGLACIESVMSNQPINLLVLCWQLMCYLFYSWLN